MDAMKRKAEESGHVPEGGKRMRAEETPTSFFDALPNELKFEVVQHLGYLEAGSLASVCKESYELVSRLKGFKDTINGAQMGALLDALARFDIHSFRSLLGPYPYKPTDPNMAILMALCLPSDKYAFFVAELLIHGAQFGVPVEQEYHAFYRHLEKLEKLGAYNVLAKMIMFSPVEQLLFHIYGDRDEAFLDFFYRLPTTKRRIKDRCPYSGLNLLMESLHLWDEGDYDGFMRLLKLGAERRQLSREGKSLLMEAIRAVADDRIIDEILSWPSEDVNINHVSPSGESLLSFSEYFKTKYLFKFLKAGVNPAMDKDLGILRLYLREADIVEEEALRIFDYYGSHFQPNSPDHEGIMVDLDSADDNDPGKRGDTLLHHYANNPNCRFSANILEAFLLNNAKPIAQNEAGETAMMRFLAMGKLQEVQFIKDWFPHINWD